MDMCRSSVTSLQDAVRQPGVRLLVGARQIRKALGRGQCRQVYLAQNADPAVTEGLASECRSAQVPVFLLPDMRELGQACNIDVGASAAAIVSL